MGQKIMGSSAAGARDRGRRASLARYALAAGAAAALAGCGGTSGSASGSSGASAPAAAARASATASGRAAATAATASAAAFTPIVEPFDPGHPAKVKSAPASCAQSSTLAIVSCYEAKAENADAAIDAVQAARYQGGPAAQKAAITADDGAWLAARAPVCAKAFHSGGTIDQVNVATCLMAESTARLGFLKGVAPPEAVLKATDNTDPAALSWYTTPAGSRIAMIDTQGDASGGAIIAWVIIGGADGFLVNPGQFYYRDGAFTDNGTVQPPSPSGHRVPPGAEYQFDIDYSHLSADPGKGGNGGWVYAPGSPVAIWR